MRALAVVFVIALAFPALAWEKSADLGLTFNQTAYSNSWTGGESGAMTWAFTGNFAAQKQMSPKVHWGNQLKLQFGQTHNQATAADGTKSWESPKKSSDRIFLESIAKLTLGAAVDPYAAFAFESQFLDASVPAVKRFLNPMLLTESVGAGRTLIKNEKTELVSRLGFALRERFDRVVVSEVPEKTDMETTTDGGIEWVTDFSHTFGSNAKYVSKLRAFQALFSSAADDLEGLPNEDYWKTADLAWENTLSASVAKYLQFSLFTELLYDKELDLRGRFREVLGIGLAYKLF
ncbi:MAG: DUF3078 domain-containing protein [Candidatus Eisenbacteria bacterium]|jgi:hypothetical protein|nr:DUF3078 domain-containing protein [Candidatus Eisenbacteria bacterium]